MYLSGHQLGVTGCSDWDGAPDSVNYLPLFNPFLSQPEVHIKREKKYDQKKCLFPHTFQINYLQPLIETSLKGINFRI